MPATHTRIRPVMVGRSVSGSRHAEQGIEVNEPQASWWWNGQSAAGAVVQVQILGRLMAGFSRSISKVFQKTLGTLFLENE